MPPPKKQSKKKKSKKRKSKQRPAQYVYPAVARPLNTATPTPYLTRFNTTSHIIYNARSAGLPLNLGALQAEQDLRRNIIAASQDGNPFAQAQLPQMMQQYDDVVSNILQRGPAPQQPQAPPQAPGQQPIGEHTQNFLRENEDYAPSESSRGSSFLGEFGRGLGLGIGSNISSIRSGTDSYSSIDSSSLFDSTFDPDSSHLSSYETGSTSLGSSVRRSELASLMFGDERPSDFSARDLVPPNPERPGPQLALPAPGPTTPPDTPPPRKPGATLDEVPFTDSQLQSELDVLPDVSADDRNVPQDLRTDPRFMSSDVNNNPQGSIPTVEAPAVDVPDRQLSDEELSQLFWSRGSRGLMLELMRAEGKVQDSIAEVEAPAVDGKSDTTIVAGDLVPASNPVKPQAKYDPFKLSYDELTISGGLPSLYQSVGMAGFQGVSTYANHQRQAAAQRQLDYERSLTLPPPDPTLALPAPSERLALTMPGYGMEHQDANYSAPAGPEPRLSDRMGFPRLGFSMDPSRYLLGKPGETDIVRPRDNSTTVGDSTTISLMGDAPLDRGPTYDYKDNAWFRENTRYGEDDIVDYGDPMESTPFMDPY